MNDQFNETNHSFQLMFYLLKRLTKHINYFTKLNLSIQHFIYIFTLHFLTLCQTKLIMLCMNTKWERLAEVRKDHGMSQEQCAKILNVSRNTWSNWENGIFEPDFMALKTISKLFNVSIDYLLSNDQQLSLLLDEKEALEKALEIMIKKTKNAR